MNKKAKAGNVALWIASFSLVLLVGAVFYMGFVQQSAVPSSPAEAQKQVEVVASTLSANKASTQSFVAKNQDSDTKAQVAPSLYVIETKNGVSTLIKDATAMSTTASTSVSTTTGAKIKAVAFSSNWYGDFSEYDVTSEQDSPVLKVYNITETLKSQCYDNAGTALAVGQCNITMGAGASDKFNYIKIEVNTSDESFNFGMLGIDVPAASNVSDINVDGTSSKTSGSSSKGSVDSSFAFSETSARPERLRTTLDYQFVPAVPIMLREWDSIKTPSIQIVASGTNPLEVLTWYIIDSGKFKSVKTVTQDQILEGVENDAPSASDTAGSDFQLVMNVN